MKRKDLLNGAKLLKKYRIKVTEEAIGLAASYLSDKRDLKTTVEFPQWLEEDINVEVVSEGYEDDEVSPEPVWVDGLSDEEPEDEDKPDPTTPSS
jgi:hypothetical protein